MVGGNLLRKKKRPKTAAAVRDPVGLDIGAQTPQEIGVSIVAQLIALFRESTEVQPESGPGSVSL